MIPASTSGSRFAPVERLVGAWFDREPGGRATFILMALFVAIWTTFQIISFSSLGLHPDLVELYAWSQHPSAGYPKHPPLGALIVAAWFTVFPAADWSFHLLAMTNAALALFAIDLIARCYLSGDKRLFVLLFLLLTPFYQFHSFNFNANGTLLSTWPIAVYCFLRAFKTRGILWSAAAGVAAALAMLGKYYSCYLVAGLIVAALSHPARWTYLKSSSPWISAAAGLVVLAPHLYWLVTNGFPTFNYFFVVRGFSSQLDILNGHVEYFAGAIGYVALPLAVYLFSVRPNRRVLARALWPSDPKLRMLVVLFAVPLLLPPLSAPFLSLKLTSLWTIQAWFLLPIILLAPNAVLLPRRTAIGVAIFVLAIAAVVTAASPGIAWIHHFRTDEESRAYYRLTSEEITTAWRRLTGTPLRIVLGDQNFAAAASFYSPDHPDSIPGFELWRAPWVNEARLQREGFAVICRDDDAGCVAAALRLTAGNSLTQRREIEVPNRYLGHTSATKKFLILLVPPRASAARPRRDGAGGGAKPT
jgi:4-amino-4-deoxy-L-arabinose transferase-like glycosyltransferase